MASGVGSFLHRSWWKANGVQVALLAIPTAVVAVVVWVHRYTVEDGFIYYRIADNLAFGDGPVFNANQRVEAYTGTLWLFVMGLWRVTLGGVMEPGVQAAITGTVFTTVGVALAALGGLSMCRRRELLTGQDRDLVVPVGLLVVVGAPAMWYLGTSGLESSSAFLWAGTVFWIMAKRLLQEQQGQDLAVDRPRWQLVVIGLGWLVRPELVLYSAMLGVLWLLLWPAPWRRRAAAVLWMIGLPIVYQVFRMGYFGSMLPNTAIAKGATDSAWSDGLAYLVDFLDYDRLLLPLVVVVCLFAVVLVVAHADRRALVVWLAPVVAGCLHAFYVVWSGGDFMHARLLVVPFFTMLTPMMALPLHLGLSVGTRRRAAGIVTAIGCSIVVLWVAATGSKWGMFRPEPIYTELRFGMTSDAVGPDALGNSDFAEIYGADAPALVARRLASERRDVVIDALGADFAQGEAVQYELTPGSGVVLRTCCIGARGLAVGPSVHVVDTMALADPIGSHLRFPEGIDGTQDIGTFVPPAWGLAPFEFVGEPLVGVAEVRQAQACGELAELVEATSAPMDVGLFLRNIVRAPSLTRLEIPVSPIEARAKFCGEAGDGAP